MLWDNYVRKATLAVRKSDYASADQALRQALQFAKENFARDDERLVMTISLLGQLYFQKQNFVQAETLLERSVKLYSDGGCLDSPCVLMDLFSLCQIKGAKGELDQALELWEEILNKAKASRRADAALMQQAVVHFERLLEPARQNGSKGNSSRAEKDSSLSRSSCPPPTASPQPTGAGADRTVAQDPAAGFYDLWTRQFLSGRASLSDPDAETETFVSAYLNLESALRLAGNVFAPGDLRVAQTMAYLAVASDRLALVDQAEMLFRQALGSVRPSTAAAAADVMQIKLQFLLFSIEHDRYYAAESLFADLEQSAFETVKASDEYVKTAAKLEDMRKRYKAYVAAQDLLMQAVTSEAAGTLETAAKMYGIALSMIRQAFRPDHPDVAQLLRCRANVLRKLGNPEQSDELEERAMRIERANEAATISARKITADLPCPDLEIVPAQTA